MERVLLVDDEKNILEDLGKHLRKKNYAVYTASTIEDARKIILSEELDYAIIDLKLEVTSEVGGIKVVNYAKRNRPKIRTIILSAYPFEHVKEQIGSDLKNEPDKAKILAEIEEDYVSKGGEKNYILAILEKLGQFKQTKKKKTCFVIMPFAKTQSCDETEWTEIYKNMIKPAIEDSGYSYTCARSEALLGNVIENILDELNRADVVIADLTDRNPNVYYELGVRHALRDATILISQRLDDIPFDLRSHAIQTYNWKTSDGRKEFKKKMREIIGIIEQEPKNSISPVRKYLKL
jgi:CheY-like chemotaxis protein